MRPKNQVSSLDIKPAPTFDVATDVVSSLSCLVAVDADENADWIVETIPIPLLVLEKDLRVRIASHAFYNTFRVTPEATAGHLVYELGNGQWNIPELRTLLEDILPNDHVFVDYEVEHTFEEIGHCTMLLNGRRLDHLQRILLVISDITKRKQLEIDLQASLQHAEETVIQLRAVQEQLVHQERLAAVGGLAAGIAHNFNNILSIILLHAELGLRISNQSDLLHTQLDIIVQQAKRAARMITQILDFGRGAALQTQPVDLVALLTEQVESLRSTLSKEITISLTYGSDVYIADVDSTRIHQIFTNLALNACDAIPDGGELRVNLKRLRLVTPHAVLLSAMELGEWFQLSVSDTGTGIETAVMSHLFEPFFTTKEAGKGTGLGLAQVYGLVRQHHGHIDVQSQAGVGTTVVIYLPAMENPA